MGSSIDTILGFIIQYQTLALIIIFLGMLLEGEIILILVGIFVQIGALDALPAVSVSLAGAVTKSFFFYFAGEKINNIWGHNKVLHYIERKVYYFFPKFKEKPFWPLFISKFIAGTNYFVIILSGYLKVDYKKFLKIEFLSTAIWFPAIYALGHFFGYVAFSISRDIKKFSLILLLFIIAFFLVDKFIAFVVGYKEGQKNGLNHE